MKGSTRTVTAIGAGYVLGRRRSFRTAAVVAAAAAAGSTPVGGMVLRRGAKLLGSTGLLPSLPPEISELVDTVRADLMPAGKAAVSTAATSRMDALTDAIHERAELVRDPGAAAAGTADTAKDTAKDTAGKAKRTGGKATSTAKGKVLDESDDESDDEPDDSDNGPDDESAPRARRAGTRRRATVTRARR